MLQFLDPALLRMARADEEAIRRLAMVILVVGLGDVPQLARWAGSPPFFELST